MNTESCSCDLVPQFLKVVAELVCVKSKVGQRGYVSVPRTQNVNVKNVVMRGSPLFAPR